MKNFVTNDTISTGFNSDVDALQELIVVICYTM